MSTAAAFAEEITVESLEADPYPIYARLREEAPVTWVPAVNMWLATTWEHALAVATDPDQYAADMPGSPVDRSFGSPTILTCDGPVHKDLRGAVDARYRPHAVEEYIDDLARPIVAAQLESVLRVEGSVELMAEFFEPVSVLALGAVLGLGDVDAPTLRRWFAGLAEGATNFEQDPDKQAVSDAVAAELDEVLAPVLERLEREPDGSGIAHMLHAGLPEGQTRPRELVLPTLKVILLGGMQEPGHGAGSVLHALLEHPDQLARVQEDLDELLAPAIEEGMRLTAPIGTQGRRVTRPVELGGAELPADAPIASVLASANRDPARFENPDAFDVHRPRQRNASFGFGRHFCSGHAFARALERIALRALLEATPSIRLDPDRPAHFSGWEFRAPRALHVLL